VDMSFSYIASCTWVYTPAKTHISPRMHIYLLKANEKEMTLVQLIQFWA